MRRGMVKGSGIWKTICDDGLLTKTYHGVMLMIGKMKKDITVPVGMKY